MFERECSNMSQTNIEESLKYFLNGYTIFKSCKEEYERIKNEKTNNDPIYVINRIHRYEHFIQCMDKYTNVENQIVLPYWKINNIPCLLGIYYQCTMNYYDMTLSSNGWSPSGSHSTHLSFNGNSINITIDLIHDYKFYPLNPGFLEYKQETNEWKQEKLFRSFIFKNDTIQKIWDIIQLVDMGEFITPLEKKIITLSSQIQSMDIIINDNKEKISNLECTIKKMEEKIREQSMELHYLKLSTNGAKVKYNYEEIKEQRKKINNEFKRIYKLIRKNIGYNLS